MTTVVAELNQLLEEAEQVYSEQQSQREMEADNQPVAMETAAAKPATTTTTVRGNTS